MRRGPVYAEASHRGSEFPAMIANLGALPLSLGGGLMLVMGRVALSIAMPELPSGRYYWQHCLWVDSSDWPNNAQMGLQVLVDMTLLYSSTVKIHGIRWYDPSDGSVFFSQVYFTPQPGGQPAVTEYNIFMAARWRMLTANGVRSYHLHRQVMPESYYENGEYTTLGRTQSQIRINTFIGQGVYRASNGHLLTEGHLAPKIASWQMRHGTKRRQRRAWLP